MDRTSVPALAFRKERHKRLCRHLRNRTAQPSTEGRSYDSTSRPRGLRDNRATGFLFFLQGKQVRQTKKRTTRPRTTQLIRDQNRSKRQPANAPEPFANIGIPLEV